MAAVAASNSHVFNPILPRRIAVAYSQVRPVAGQAMHAALRYDGRVSEFESGTENAALKQRIINRIHAEGEISFRDFMAMALYEPGLGYYTSNRVVLGRQGDYLTSPEVSPIFGAMVGRQLREMWDRLGSPPSFDLVEAGAGSGVLARDILSWARRTAPGFFAAARYTIAEVSAQLAARQRDHLEAEGLAEKVSWTRGLPPSVKGVIFSNELLDAMPVHRVAVENGRLLEVFVTWDGAYFAEELREASSNVARHFQWLGLLPTEGNRAEVNLESIEWVRTAAASLERGFLLTIDYGYEAQDLYAPWRREGTLLCFYRHNPCDDPYLRIGRQDMTSHIDLTSVSRAGEEAGLATLGLVSQSEFLANLGISEAMQPPEGGDLEEYFARRAAVTELLDPGGLGRISVLVQGKDCEKANLSGLRSD
jgi:SAM-dependent MidA family methyltransferase